MDYFENVHKNIIVGVKPIALIIAAAFLCWPSVQGQNKDVIKPGDVLTVKFRSHLAAHATGVGKTVFVTSEGRLTPPVLYGIKPSEDLSVAGLSLDEAALQLQDSYHRAQKPEMRTNGMRVRLFEVEVERGVRSQLLNQ